MYQDLTKYWTKGKFLFFLVVNYVIGLGDKCHLYILVRGDREQEPMVMMII